MPDIQLVQKNDKNIILTHQVGDEIITIILGNIPNSVGIYFESNKSTTRYVLNSELNWNTLFNQDDITKIYMDIYNEFINHIIEDPQCVFKSNNELVPYAQSQVFKRYRRALQIV